MIEVIRGLAECRALWEDFSPHLAAWDEWELMDAFHDQSRCRLNFLWQTGNGHGDGLLPLVHDTSDDSYELFGGCYPDCRVLWLDIAGFPEVFDHLPENTAFFDLKGEWVAELLRAHPRYEPNFSETDQRYFLMPETFAYDFTNHIDTFSVDRRRVFLHDLKKIREKSPLLEWSEADESELFIHLVNRRFGDDSDYASAAGRQEVRRVVSELKALGYLRTLVISIAGARQAVSLSALYRDTLIVMYEASNRDYNNLGKLLNVETIQEGCRLRVREISFMTGMAWKAAWKMASEPCRTMRKPARPPVAESATTA